MERLKPEAIRVQLGLSQDDFAKKLSISRSAYQAKIHNRTKWYVDELEAMKELAKLESIERIDWS